VAAEQVRVEGADHDRVAKACAAHVTTLESTSPETLLRGWLGQEGAKDPDMESGAMVPGHGGDKGGTEKKNGGKRKRDESSESGGAYT
jgi:hypothetical protein